MRENLIKNPTWVENLKVSITHNGRFKVESPCGHRGFGRTRDAAIRDCAENITKGHKC